MDVIWLDWDTFLGKFFAYFCQEFFQFRFVDYRYSIDGKGIVQRIIVLNLISVVQLD